ncbi:MAG: hypothetical protein NVS4B1_32010 [Ktedonobacteraceae bacterium]
METKRCAQCHKLLRAETHTCSRCGYTFQEKKRKVITRDLTRPSLPPASPHRAGHYSGLHPEDQPYQSSMIAVQHPPVREVEEIALLSQPVQEMSEQPTIPLLSEDAPTQISVRYEKLATEVDIRNRQPQEQVEAPSMRRERPLLDTDGALPALYQLPQPKKIRTAKRTISLLLTLACVFFLLASGILVYVLMASKSTSPTSLKLTVRPPTVRASDIFTLSGSGFIVATQVKFTYDDEKPINDSMGHQLAAVVDRHNAFSVDVITPTSWGAGAHTIYAIDEAQQASISTSITVEAPSEASPKLQLSTTSIDLGTNSAGTTSSKQITLKNVGGRNLTWQQKSDATWLTAAPTGGNSYTFAGSASVTITANRSNLTPKSSYTGHITFAQKDGSDVAKLTVTMSVDSAPAALNVSLSSLTFAATSTQSVPTQAVMLQNSGGKPLNWQATATTNDGANWLYLGGASSGRIDPTQSQQLIVGVQAQALAAGLYQGAIALTGGASATINVSLTVIAPGNILVTPTTLNFTGLTQQSISSKVLTLQNTGGQAQTWSTSIAVDQGNWLSTTSQSSSVNPGSQVPISVNITTTGLKAGSYQGTLTFTVGNQITVVPVALTLTTPPAAAISVQSTALTFQTTWHNDPLGQTLTITNTGNAVLNWTATESGNGATFAPLSVTNGSLSPQNSSTITVSPSVANQPPGTLNTTITIADSDAGTTVVSQKIQVTVIIHSQAAISTSPVNFSLTQINSTNPSVQTVAIINTGTATLNWSATVRMDAPVGGTWLSIDTASGTLAPGASRNIVVSCNSTGLTKGVSYSGIIQISDSDTGTTVAPQTVYLTFFP